MTKRLFPQVEVKSRKTKESGISHLRENGPHSSDEGILVSKPIFIQGVSEILLKHGEHKSPPEHTFIWCLA